MSTTSGILVLWPFNTGTWASGRDRQPQNSGARDSREAPQSAVFGKHNVAQIRGSTVEIWLGLPLQNVTSFNSKPESPKAYQYL